MKYWFGLHLVLAVFIGILMSGTTTAQQSPVAVPSNPTSIPGVTVIPDVVYGHKDGMALTYDVFQTQGKC